MSRFDARELDQLKGRLAVYGSGQSPAEAWNDAVGQTSPLTFYNTLSRDIPGRVEMTVESARGGQGNLTIRVSHGGKTLIDIENKFSKPHNYIFFDEWRVGSEEHRGKGLGSILLDNHLEAMKPWGLRFIELRAGREDGPVYWAKKGFRIKDESYAERFNRIVRENYDRHKEKIDPATCQDIETILKAASLDANIRLASIPGALDGKKLSAVLLSGSNTICVVDLEDKTQMESVRTALKDTASFRNDITRHFPAAPHL
jgi:hypothetical protein